MKNKMKAVGHVLIHTFAALMVYFIADVSSLGMTEAIGHTGR